MSICPIASKGLPLQIDHDLSFSERFRMMDKIALVLLGCLALSACATPTQTAGTTAGALGGALVGGPVGAVVGGAAGAVVTAPGGPVGGPYRYRCRRFDYYGNVHYRWCRA
jgi:osmotically inducible lipoprotein OsmB